MMRARAEGPDNEPILQKDRMVFLEIVLEGQRLFAV